ncbi:sensor histidine kinase [Pseudotabrizicola sp. L79]|uniref:sensor histidine kinase n=1 Tax=Pseudotabrizicola sp. L79 TaxID=3118402 RepID=UPI002F938654
MAFAKGRVWFETDDCIEGQLVDYAEIGQRLFWQRQTIFGVALLLAAFYYSLPLAFLNLLLVVITEMYDGWVFRSILTQKRSGQRLELGHFWAVVIGTIASAGTISFFAIWISILQGQSSHFMPLFFLFAAGVFAAMNNHYIVSVLAIRLGIYGVTFLFIPIRDIVLTGADIQSELWVQLFASVFVAYFIVDCARIFLSMYRKGVNRLKELEEQNRKVEAALAAKSAFLSTMSHELRTPLTSISASLDLALSGKLGAVDTGPKKVLEIAQRNSGTLKTLIDQVLDLQKASAGHLSLECSETDLTSLVQEAVEVNEPYVGKLGSVLRFDKPDGVVMAPVDRTRIKQALSNLVSNAAKFSPSGTEVVVRLVSDQGQAVIEVSDQGEGLDEKSKDRVFAPFTQLDSSDSRKVGGTGLGLSITKQIVEAHRGRIDYRSKPGQGTTFSFTLPLLGSVA